MPPLDDLTRERLETIATLVDPSGAQPSTEAELAEAERHLGRRLPEELRWWVTHVGTTAAVGGDLSLDTQLQPVGPDDRSSAITTASDQLRDWDWEIPDELIVFGGNGGGDPFAIWAPASGDGIPAVVCIGSGHSEADPCLWIVGDSLSGFLRGYLACYAFWLEDPDEVYDALEIPELLQPPDEEEYEPTDPALNEIPEDDGHVHRAVLRYTSPSLGDLVTEPWHDRRLSSDELRKALSR